MAYIRGSRHPHEVLLLIAAFLLGIFGLVLFDKVATTTIRALPQWSGYLLYAGLTVGAGVSLVGVFWRSLIGSVIERTGLFSLGLFCLIYMAIVVINSGVRGLSFGLMMAAFGIANFVRVWQISHEIKETQALRAVLREGEADGLA